MGERVWPTKTDYIYIYDKSTIGNSSTHTSSVNSTSHGCDWHIATQNNTHPFYLKDGLLWIFAWMKTDKSFCNIHVTSMHMAPTAGVNE